MKRGIIYILNNPLLCTVSVLCLCPHIHVRGYIRSSQPSSSPYALCTLSSPRPGVEPLLSTLLYLKTITASYNSPWFLSSISSIQVTLIDWAYSLSSSINRLLQSIERKPRGRIRWPAVPSWTRAGARTTPASSPSLCCSPASSPPPAVSSSDMTSVSQVSRSIVVLINFSGRVRWKPAGVRPYTDRSIDGRAVRCVQAAWPPWTRSLRSSSRRCSGRSRRPRPTSTASTTTSCCRPSPPPSTSPRSSPPSSPPPSPASSDASGPCSSAASPSSSAPPSTAQPRTSPCSSSVVSSSASASDSPIRYSQRITAAATTLC